MRRRTGWRPPPPAPKNLAPSTLVRELARAADIIDRARRRTSTFDATRKGCEKAVKVLNETMAGLLKGERDGI